MVEREEARKRALAQWGERERFLSPHCSGCTDPRHSEPNFLHDLFALQGDEPVMRLCKWCRRHRARNASGSWPRWPHLTLREFRDAVTAHYPDAAIVRYRPTPRGLEPRPFTIDDEE